ncbi:MAG TPA: hypothetical protein VFZ63_01945 [Jiangellaceae bacterium]
MSMSVTTTAGSTFLRRVLLLDAVVTAGNGLIYLAASGLVGRLLDVPAGLLVGLGIFMLLYGGGVGYLGTRPVPSNGWVEVVIAGNAAWVAASFAVLLFGWLEPSTVGTVWIPMQAAVVAGFAVLQALGLRWRERG